MKKFTRNFLSGGYHSALWILRSFALGLIALLWTSTAAYAQTCSPPSGPVHFYADTTEACYNGSNLYEVTISVMDFWNVDSINLFLDYNEAFWTFEDADILEDVFENTDTGPNGTNQPMIIEDDGSVLNFHWTEWVTRGRIQASVGNKVPIVKLTFSLKNFPNNILSSYTNNLDWQVSNNHIYYCGGGSNFNEFTSTTYTNGEIETSVLYDNVTITIDPATVDCPLDRALVTVTNPVGTDFEYSFNGDSWTNNPQAEMTAGDHVVWVKDANGCLSVKKYFTIEAEDPLTYNVNVEDESCDNLGEIEINIQGGSGTITYWVVPDSVYAAGPPPFDTKYSSTITNQFGLPAGIYWVSVQDDCGYHDWESYVIDPGSEIDYNLTYDQLTVSCYNGSDGQITVGDLANGYPYAPDIYHIYIPNVIDTMHSAALGDLVISNIPVGVYELSVGDSVCADITNFTINNADSITFYVDYIDAPCTAATGALWINVINDDTLGVQTLTVDTTGWTYHVVGANVDTTLSVSDTLFELPANYYSVWLIPGCPGEIPFDNHDGSGNVVPILDDGSITFNVIVTAETCEGECDGTIEVTDVLRTCGSCNDNAVYQYRADGGDWIGVDSIVGDFCAPDTVLIEVRDSSDPAVCIVSREVVIPGPTEALTAVVDTAYSPTCPDGNDGWVRMYVSGGTAPYEYSVDNSPNWRDYPSFGLTEGGHLLKVRDANGCIWSDSVFVDYLVPNAITAELIDTIQCPGDMPLIQVTLDTFSYYDDITKYSWYANDVSFLIDTTGMSDGMAMSQTGFAPGTYYIKAKDPNGCYSNVDTVVIEDVIPLQILDPVVENATCYGTWSGRIILSVTGGNPDSVFYYAMANNPDVFNNPNANINWVPFAVDSVTEYIEVQKGTYYLQVKDACEETQPVEVVVDGYDEIDVIANNIDIIPVACYGDSSGTITVPADAVTGGAPGYGVGKYLYTLKQVSTNVTTWGTHQQESNTWTGLPAGDYWVYVYDDTDPTADPAMCPPDSAMVTVKQPVEPLDFDTWIRHVSCAGEEDGEIHVYISGGIGGSWTLDGQQTDPEPDGNSYDVTINQITGDYNYSLQLQDVVDTVAFQTMGGDFEIIVRDANGCEVKDTVTVFEPKPWVITPIVEEPSDCNEADGKIWATVTGGFDTLDIDDIRIQVFLGGIFIDVITMGDTILLIDTAQYGIEYDISVDNELSTPGGFWLELADKQCTGDTTVVINPFNPFEFDVAVECVKCYGGDDGKVTISNITGGAGAYQIQLVGGDNPSYDAGNDDLWWPKEANGDPMYVSTDIVFDTLSAGDYWIYLRDDSGFTLANCCRPIKFEMCEPDTLMLETVTLVNNVDCAGDSTGAASIQAIGGVGPYSYLVTRTDTSSTGFPYIGLPADPQWQSDSIITGLPVGTYIGWVRDANGCITGCEINSQGLPIDEHRVVIREADAITFDDYTITEPVCYGGLADVNLYGVEGGSGDTMTVTLTGKTYMGMDTTYTFADLPTGLDNYVLEDVYASDDDGYVISVVTDANCTAEGEIIVVTQPPIFDVTATITSGAYCVGDDQVLITIDVTGGQEPYMYDIYMDGNLHRENSIIDNHVLFVGHEYVVVAKDAVGCSVSDTLFIETPLPVEFTIRDISCYGDEKASARISATGTPGRQFRVLYQEIENEVPAPTGWTTYNGWFTDHIDLMDTFIFDNENIDDVHYEFIIEDEFGCRSELGVMTFDKVQHPLGLYIDEGNLMECSQEMVLNVTGGADPYVVTIDGDTVTDLTMVTLSRGSHEVVITDDHLRCMLVDTIVVDAPIVVVDTTVNTYIGESVQFVFDMANLDSMLVVDNSPYEFMYTDTTSMCERMLRITVVEVPREYAIEDLHNGTLNGEIAKVTGTVTAVADGEGFFMQDSNNPNSGLWIEYSDVNTSGIQVGDGVAVVGTVAELSNVTSIQATSVEMATGTVVVTPIELTPNAVEDEQYESMLVKVIGARATAADAGNGEWTIYLEPTDDVTVNDWLYAYTPNEGDFYTVTGVVNSRLDTYKVEPRMESDIVNLTATAVDPTATIDFKVYPNPFNDKIYIDNNDKLARVVITNIAGQRVIDVEYPEREIRTGNLVSGVYLVNLFTEKGLVKTDRIIKR
ncbi:MAG: hypothetical protein CSA36_02560 [Draconibacterium sp.]|nr:MAG: hypothetical protein CSA36_02560 [Draconibacterium sp.]